MKLLRALSGVYLVSTFIIASLLYGFFNERWMSTAVFIGITFQVVFTFVLISGNRIFKHSFGEIIAIIFLPIIIFLIFQFEITKTFWFFIGFFNFFVITGGGIVGLLFSPLIAKISGQSSQSIGKEINRGANYWQRAGLTEYAAFIFGWLALGFVFLVARTQDILDAFSQTAVICFSIVFVFCLLLVIVRTFQSTSFSLKEKYKN